MWIRLILVSDFPLGRREAILMEGKCYMRSIFICLWATFNSCTFRKSFHLWFFWGGWSFHKILTWIHLIFTFLGESCSIWSMFTSIEMLLLEAACRSFESPHAWVSIFTFSWQLLHSPEHAGFKLLLKHAITGDDLTPTMWCQVMAIGSNVNKRKLASWR